MEQYDLIDLRSFIAVVESGSFVRAAEQLDVSTAAISRRIATLEAALGSQLITRTTRRNDITDAGRAFYADAQAVFQLLDEAQERVRQGQDSASGTLRVAAPLSFGIQKVAPVLPPFMRRHPDLKVQLLLEDRTTDLHAEAIDVALRIGFLRDSSLVATRIGSVGRVFAAAPGYLARAGRPTTLAELRGHSVLNYSLLSVREEWGRLIGDPGEQLDLKVPLAANNAEALAEWAIQGMGIVLLPEFALAGALADGRLVQLLADASPEPYGLFAVRPSRQFTPARLRLFIEYLRECGF
ncbi:LysR substrate-binding domain-containing protein [Pseudoduganella sp.]|uniref:LysR family transcriptional regulator n=1 Tax=Pseudoduganella sp. TaxID=1880898 RepID=UPI0035AE42B3